jgi:hypothetical protein
MPIRELLQSRGPRTDRLTLRSRLFAGAAVVGRAIRSEWWGGPLTALVLSKNRVPGFFFDIASIVVLV